MIQEKDTLPKNLRHYTSFPKLINILSTRALRFSGPENWKDKNDRASVLAFQRIKGAAKIGVICFNSGQEKALHWMEYAPGGACIKFKTPKLLAALKNDNRFLSGLIEYKKIKEVNHAFLQSLPHDRLPFLKRSFFEAENEYRAIWTSDSDSEEMPLLPLDGCIDSVTLDSEYAEPKWEPLVTNLQEKFSVTIKISKIFESGDWQDQFTQLK